MKRRRTNNTVLVLAALALVGCDGAGDENTDSEFGRKTGGLSTITALGAQSSGGSSGLGVSGQDEPNGLGTSPWSKKADSGGSGLGSPPSGGGNGLGDATSAGDGASEPSGSGTQAPANCGSVCTDLVLCFPGETIDWEECLLLCSDAGNSSELLSVFSCFHSASTCSQFESCLSR